MTTLGIRATAGELIVQTGGDFVWSYTWTVNKVPTDFPEGSKLDLLIGLERHPFVIVGPTATVKIESEESDTLEDGTPFRLRFTEPGTPTTETILVHGTVQRDDPEGLS